jgi:outer membrane usher protein
MSLQNYKAVKINRLVLLVSLALGTLSFNTFAGDYFNPELLQIDNPQQGATDLSIYESQGGQAPDTYHVDIFINNDQADTRDVVFKLVAGENGKETLQPCLSAKALAAMGVKTELFPDLGDGECASLSAIPMAHAEYRFGQQQLLLSIPQAAVSQAARGFVAPEMWDNGITAMMLNYSITGANNYARTTNAQDNDSQYVNLRPGINIGPWRLRNYSTYSRSSDNQSQWDTVYTYAQRSIISLKSQMLVGDSSSPADVFDSVPFRGAQLASDDDMIPDSQKGYAPVVRGIARSNAQVIIRQNGYVIYQSFVAPGAFEITDMYPTGGSGDLFVTIKEADGSEQTMVVPFASLPVLQREGRLKYSVTGGKYRSYDSSVDKTPFMQGTAIYGLPHGFTMYGGSQAASHYQSAALGMGKNLGDYGAISVDITQALSTVKDQDKRSGQSMRARYSKDILQTGTNVTIAGYRYSTSGYYSMQDVMDSYRSGQDNPLTERQKNRTELSMNQNLWENAGTVSVSLINEDYWNSGRNMRSVTLGYNNSWQGISYGLNYSYNENSTAQNGNNNAYSGGSSGRIYDRDQVFAFNISIPLSRWMSNTYSSYSLSSSQKGNTTQNVGLNGTALEDNNLSWSAQESYGSKGTGNGGNLNADYRGTYGEVNGGYSYDKDSQRLNYGLQGGILVHENGMTLGQPLGETIALVKAPGAGNVGVSNQTGVKTDWRGYAIVPYTSPYRKNAVQLNTETLPDDVDLTLTSQTVIPTRGAVVRANFKASVGQRVLMTLMRQGGAPVPFGAMVTASSQKDAPSFIVGDEGQVYLTGLENDGTLTAKWGNDAAQQCQVNYALKETLSDNTQIMMINAQCK